MEVKFGITEEASATPQFSLEKPKVPTGGERGQFLGCFQQRRVAPSLSEKKAASI